ncbi:hypothetical protein [Aetokthonos hydrillicola]
MPHAPFPIPHSQLMLRVSKVKKVNRQNFAIVLLEVAKELSR